MAIRFHDFTITDDGELFRSGAPVHLQPQPMKVLALLASRARELVTREEIQKHVWPETFVEVDQSLNWCIRRIREVLDDDASAPRFIQTLPRRGYRFIAPVAQHARPHRRWLPAAVLALTALVFGARTQFATATVLVLPFDDLGTETRRANDIATAELINALASVDPQRLSVIDPLTAMKLKGTKECIRVLGRQLDAQYVLLGEVRQKGTALRTTAQMFRVADNRQVWAAAREIPHGVDPSVTYSAIAREVASRLSEISSFANGTHDAPAAH